jgi:hypothetical protein
MKKSPAVLGVVVTLGVVLVTASAHAGEPAANPETQPGAPPAPGTGWTVPHAPSPPMVPAPGKSSSVTLKVSTESDVSPTPPPPNTLPPQQQGPVQLPTTAALRNGAGPDPDQSPHGKLADPLTEARFLHGFRLGYAYTANYDKPLESLEGKSFKEKTGTKSPNSFLLGYEVFVRMVGHSWLNVILVGNGLLAGLEQSKVLPSGNALIGFEFNNSFQVGVGAHLTPLKGQEAHTAFAAGWTPRVGTFYVPIHGFFVPDVDGNHRMGMLTGVTF